MYFPAVVGAVLDRNPILFVTGRMGGNGRDVPVTLKNVIVHLSLTVGILKNISVVDPNQIVVLVIIVSSPYFSGCLYQPGGKAFVKGIAVNRIIVYARIRCSQRNIDVTLKRIPVSQNDLMTGLFVDEFPLVCGMLDPYRGRVGSGKIQNRIFGRGINRRRRHRFGLLLFGFFRRLRGGPGGECGVGRGGGRGCAGGVVAYTPVNVGNPGSRIIPADDVGIGVVQRRIVFIIIAGGPDLAAGFGGASAVAHRPGSHQIPAFVKVKRVVPGIVSRGLAADHLAAERRGGDQGVRALHGRNIIGFLAFFKALFNGWIADGGQSADGAHNHQHFNQAEAQFSFQRRHLPFCF